MSDKTFKNDATQKLIGYDYQKLIALERCLNAKKNENIWIECKGDVADADVSIEVKHHNVSNNITINSVDLWKTIKNYVTEFEIVSQFSSLILFTTSIISKDSILVGWNDLSPNVKKSILISHVPTKTTQEFYDAVKSCPESDLLNILSKFKIYSEQPNINQKWEEIMDHPTFATIPNNLRNAALQQLCGYISKKAIDNHDEWKVGINDFKKDIQTILSNFTHGNTPFPVIDPNDKNLPLDKRDFAFIDKMKAVMLKKREQANAVSDYLRANMSQFELIGMTPTLSDNLKTYDENVKRMLEDNKSRFTDNLTTELIDTEHANKISREFYRDSIEKPHESIIGVNDTQKYYKDGRIHHLLENTAFEWKFKEEDL